MSGDTQVTWVLKKDRKGGGESVPGKGKSKCKGPEAGKGLETPKTCHDCPES